MNEIMQSITTIALAVIGLAIVSVLVSRNALTGSVISAGASGFAQDLGAAEAPVTGNSYMGLGGIPAFNSQEDMFGSTGMA